MKKRQFGKMILAVILCVGLFAGADIQDAFGGNNLRKGTSVKVMFSSTPVYNGHEIVPSEFIRSEVYTNLSESEPTKIDDPEISYSFYKYRKDRPNGPDESSDKLDWDKTPEKVGSYWVKVKFAGDAEHLPASSDYYKFSIKKTKPTLTLSTNMKSTTKIGDTITITLTFRGVDMEKEDFQPVGKAVFQAGGKYLSQAVDFHGNQAQITYKLTAKEVDIKGEYVSGSDNENYDNTSVILQKILGNKRPQETLKIGCSAVAYGTNPFLLSVKGGSGDGAVSYHSSNTMVASIDKRGKVTVHHPGKTVLTVTKDGDDTYARTEAAYTLQVKKGLNPDKPKRPVLLESDDHMIRVKTTQGQEFSIDGGKSWSAGGVFRKLKASKKYTVITRLTENETYEAGRTTRFLEVTTDRDRKQSAENVTEKPKTDSRSGSRTNGSKWHSLGGNGVSKEVTADKEINGNQQKTAMAEGTLKGDSAAQTDTQMSDQQSQTDPMQDGMNPEEENNEIISTGKRSPKKHAAGAALAVVPAAGACVAVSGGMIYRKKRRKTEA